MAEPAIKYSVITAYSNKGIVAAEKGLAKLGKSFKKTSLARKLTFAAMGASFVALAKQSADAAIADEKSIKVLSFTLNNLGRSFQEVPIESFIDRLSRSSGVADQILRPALGQLLTVTNDLGKSYEALTLATDIAAVTGDDYTLITDALAKGFAGQTMALKKLVPGLDQAALKTGDMVKLMDQLNGTFGGAAKNNLTTYAGQLAILKVSANKALENIGKGLIDFLKGFTKTNSITDMGLAIEKLGITVGDIFRGLPVYLKTFLAATDKSFQESWFGRNVLLPLINGLTRGLTEATTAAAKAGKQMRELSVAGGWGRLYDVTVIKKFNKATDKTTANMKKAAATTKLQGMFDIDAIQIAAALRGNISDLERAKLEGMTALKTKATDDDIAAIKKIEYETIRADAAAMNSQNLVLKNTYDFYNSIFNAAKEASDKISKLPFNPAIGGTSVGTFNKDNGAFNPTQMPFIPSLAMPDTNAAPSYSQDLIDQMAPRGAVTNAQSITVNMQGGINIGTQYEFYESVQRAVQEANRNGWSLSGLPTG